MFNISGTVNRASEYEKHVTVWFEMSTRVISVPETPDKLVCTHVDFVSYWKDIT